MRLFIAIPLGSDLIDNLSRIQKRLSYRLPDNSVKWTRSGQMHLTLRFLGETPEDQITPLKLALKSATESHSCFELVVRQVGCFPSFSQPRVIWAGIAGDTNKLTDLFSHIQAQTVNFGQKPEDRKFHPHLTLGRVKTDKRSAQKIGQILDAYTEVEFGDLRVERVELIQSTLSRTGPIYQNLDSITL
jgi:RNA 2',3'-cyclic 3'-phosphodiesterase